MLFRLLLVALLVAALSAQTDTSPALFTAIQRGSASDVERLLKAGVSPNVADADGVPALMAATLFADADTVELLLSRGADPNRTGPGGATALMWAVPDVEKMRRLIDHGANVNARSETDRTALLVAASYPAHRERASASSRSRSRPSRRGSRRIDGAVARHPIGQRRRRAVSRREGTGSESAVSPRCARGRRTLRPPHDRLPDVEGAGFQPGSPGRRGHMAARRSSGTVDRARSEREHWRQPGAILADAAHERRGVGSRGRGHGEAAARSRRRPERENDGRRNVARLGDLQRRPREDPAARAAWRRAWDRAAP